MNATTVAVDLAKSAFQIAVADQHWKVVEKARLTRAQFFAVVRQPGGRAGGNGGLRHGSSLGPNAARSGIRSAAAAGALR